MELKQRDFIEMGQNTFNDMTDRFQLFTEAEPTKYISFQSNLRYSSTTD